jgi:hypothetical protein
MKFIFNSGKESYFSSRKNGGGGEGRGGGLGDLVYPDNVMYSMRII